MLIFDVNDFDEAYLGHFTWDLQRFAASMAVVRDDHPLFVEAFRNDELAGVHSTEKPRSAGSAG